MSEKIKVERNGEVYYVYETDLVKRFKTGYEKMPGGSDWQGL